MLRIYQHPGRKTLVLVTKKQVKLERVGTSFVKMGAEASKQIRI